MMKFISLISTILICISAKAQVQIIPDVDTSLYIGIDNGITLKSPSVKLSII